MLIQSIISSFRREVREIVSDRLYLSILVLFPIVMSLFFCVIFYRGAIDNLPIAVVDRDYSPLSRQLLSSDVEGILYIDKGFEESVYRGESGVVGCYLSGANISACGVLSRDIQLAVQSFSAGVALQSLESMGLMEAQAMVEIMPINIQSNIISNPYLNYGYYLAPIFMILGVVVFTVLSTIYAIGRELRYGTALEWLAEANDSLVCGVIGKLVPVTTSMFVMSQFVYFVLFVVMGMECLGSYLVLSLITVLFILVYEGVALAIIAWTANLRLALSLGGGYSVMAFTFSGITFPTIAMLGVARWFSKLFPLSYFSEVFVSQVMRGAPMEYDIDNLVYMALFLLVVPLSWRRLSRVVKSQKYWGGE